MDRKRSRRKPIIHRNAAILSLLLYVAALAPALADEGTIQGKMVVNGKAIAFNHVYAIARPVAHEKDKEEIRVIFSDAPLDDDVMRHDRERLRDLAATGKLHAIAVTIADDMFGHGKWAKTKDIYTVEINKGWVGSSGYDLLEMKSVDASTVAGRLHTDGPHKIFQDTFDYDVTFSAPIRR